MVDDAEYILEEYRFMEYAIVNAINSEIVNQYQLLINNEI